MGQAGSVGPGSTIEIRRVLGEDEVPEESGKFVKEGASRESSGQS